MDEEDEGVMTIEELEGLFEAGLRLDEVMVIVARRRYVKDAVE